MSYLTPAFLQFFEALSKNNSTAWFNENRKTYEKEVKKPFEKLVQVMIDQIQKHEPEVQIKPSEAIMRINKDIRFSKDKTPYNVYVAANISKFGKKDKSYPGFYFQLSPEGISIFGGAYMIENATLSLIRNYLAENPEAFSAVYKDPTFKAKFGTIQGEKNKRISAELQEIASREPLIANKQFYYSANLTPELITSDALPEVLMEYYLAGKKVNDYLKLAIELPLEAL
ncbi:DUF2461 domain-containing protein [Adhaeribacter sp. BT258]|uniref:DUF2461 domain-containing protein n=1 Tax=Adhaeribacter terrigena TaxID=2793070 RepID=A0ABS1BZF3_9BACT|nr:DUF2461 domain-containing protein [Adhaeribacter terrigena]MBK0402529.1 DUF2461 domain-containing protein [Adhaeribacter terrigena]